MTPKTSTHFRLSAASVEKLEALAERYGTRTTAVEVAIDRLYQEDIGRHRPRHMDTTDRVTQVNWLQAEAGDIATYSGIESPEQAVEAVELWVDALETDNELPIWFDPHDYHLMTEYVKERM